MDVMRVKKISDGLNQGGDNFLLLRFVAAAMVIYGHAPAITGGGGPPDLFVWLGWGEYSGAIAVDLFFVISGFLVTGSFLRRRHVADFAWARLIRIIPAYAACLIFCAFVVGPLFTANPLGEYFSNPESWAYVTKNLHLNQEMAWDLPGVFTGNPKRSTINGSIWTLPAEVRMYTWAALLGLVGVISRRWLFNIVIVGLFIYGFFYPNDILFVPLSEYVRLAGLFAVGAFCYVNRSWVPVHGALLLAAAGLSYLCRSTTIYPFLFACCEALFVFWFAYNVRWRGFHRLGDYSYGIYLWGFPAQQMIAAIAGSLPFVLNALAGFCVALLLAIASWHAIEKPALKLKGAPSALANRIGREWARRIRRSVTP